MTSPLIQVTASVGGTELINVGTPNASITTTENGTVVEDYMVAGPTVLEVAVAADPDYVEIIQTGPTGPPGDTRVFIGNTPPADTSLVWVDTSP